MDPIPTSADDRITALQAIKDSMTTPAPTDSLKLNCARERKLRLSLQATCSFVVNELKRAGRKIPTEPLQDALEALENALETAEAD